MTLIYAENAEKTEFKIRVHLRGPRFPRPESNVEGREIISTIYPMQRITTQVKRGVGTGGTLAA